MSINMNKHLRNLALALTGLSSLFILALAPISAHAAATIDCNNPATSADAVTCGTQSTGKASCTINGVTSTNSTTCVNHTIANVINIFSWIVGIVAVIMIIYGGFRYVTSGGDSGAISAAKNTILYAIIGLVVVSMAQIIVHFVLSRTT